MKVPCKYQQTVKELSKNQNYVIMRKDKRRGMVIMNKSKCHEKYIMILENGNFKTLDHDLTKKTEEKVQWYLQIMKVRLSWQEYLHLYPGRSCLSKFYGIAKVRKISKNDTIDKLPIRPIVLNIGTATYDLAKYLAKSLSSLNQSEYIIKNAKQQFVKQIRIKQVPDGYKIVSFDVKPLFTNASLRNYSFPIRSKLP